MHNTVPLLSVLSRRGFHISPDHLLVGVIGVLAVAACVVLHFEVMRLTLWALPKLKIPRHVRVLVAMLATMTAHIVEVWIFGLTYWILDAWPRFGQLEGTVEQGAVDFIYFSVASFTTIGFGDIIPTGAIRTLCGAEALTGLGLITWSASFVFLEMQRDWTEFKDAE